MKEKWEKLEKKTKTNIIIAGSVGFLALIIIMVKSGQ